MSKEEDKSLKKTASTTESATLPTPTLPHSMSTLHISTPASVTPTNYPITHGHLVNNPLYADAAFVLGPKTFHGHSAILYARCGGALLNSKSHPSKKKKNILEVDVPNTITPSIFLEVLKFVYTGIAEVEKMKEHDLVQLAGAAVCFEGLDRLQFLCEQQLQKMVNLTNVYSVLKGADQYNLKYMKDFCVHYAIQNYKSFINNKESVKDLGIVLFQQVVVAQQQSVDGELPALVTPSAPSDTFVQDLKTMHDSNKYTDLEIQLQDKNMLGISGTVYKCHRALLASRSAPLADLIAHAQPGKPILLKAISHDGFIALLKWLYYGHAALTNMEALELVVFGRDYKLVDLQKLCVDILRNGVTNETALLLMDLSYIQGMPDFFYDAMREILPKCIKHIVNNFDDVEIKQIRTKKLNPTIAIELLLVLQQYTSEGVIPETVYDRKATVVSPPPNFPYSPPSSHSSNGSTVAPASPPPAINTPPLQPAKSEPKPEADTKATKPADTKTSKPVETKSPKADSKTTSKTDTKADKKAKKEKKEKEKKEKVDKKSKKEKAPAKVDPKKATKELADTKSETKSETKTETKETSEKLGTNADLPA